jgi:methyl-accepting chemotaxis protein
MNSIQNSSLNSQNTSNDEQILRTLIEIKNQQIRTSSANREMLENELAEIRNSLNIATQELSKGATEEITEALKAVIENFNENLTAQFGDNFVKLNDAVFKLVEWQENYKQHVEDMEHRLEVSTSSVEKSRHSIEAIAEANREVSTLYEKLSAIISTYHTQSANLNTDLEKLHTLAPEISEIVGQMGNSFVDMKTAFGEMLGSVIVENEKIGDSFKKSSDAILDSFTNGQSSLERQRYEINAITNHFRTMGEQVPEALRVSLIELEKALTTITHKFQRDYEEVMLRYKGNLE